MAAYMAGAEPLVQRHEQANAWAEQLVQARQHRQDLLASNHDLKARLTGVEQALASSSGAVLQPARLINQRMAALTALANETGLQVQSVNPGTPGPGSSGTTQRFSRVPISMSSTGSYQTSAEFLHRLHQAFHDMSVTRIDLTDDRGEGESASFAVQLIWYVAPTSR